MDLQEDWREQLTFESILVRFEGHAMRSFGTFKGSLKRSEMSLHNPSDKRWVKPLLDAGYVELEREQKWDDGSVSLYYRPTDSGIRWWIDRRNAGYKGREIPQGVSVYFLERLSGKGIGAELSFSEFLMAPAFEWLSKGDFEYVQYHEGHPSFRRMSESISVALTKSGYDNLTALERERPVEVF